MRTRALLVAAVVGLLALAACGNDKSDNSNASKTAQTTVASDAAMTVTFKTDLTGGTTEVPQPGDPDGKGSATVKIDADAGKVCYTITVENIATPVASHIHEGAAGGAGPIVITFNPEKIGKGEDCLTGQKTDDLKRIVANPSGFYVNVHTGDFAGGAVRGQLAKA
jgi:ABC-type glycerol-3-phosphate transport system substrate-binding protein